MGNKTVRRIAMWSGSPEAATLLMRSWGNREDTWVWDEPFYAHYLARKAPAHPLTTEVLAHHESDRAKIEGLLTAPLPAGKTVGYQKHTAQYLPADTDRSWLAALDNCLLIREPRAMINDLILQVREPGIEHTGLRQQIEIFEYVREHRGTPPPVLAIEDLMRDPRRQLTLLCQALDLEFSERMLSWPPGPRETDGVWGKRFYTAVASRTGFPTHRKTDETLSGGLVPMYGACLEYYRVLHPFRLGAGE